MQIISQGFYFFQQFRENGNHHSILQDFHGCKMNGKVLTNLSNLLNYIYNADYEPNNIQGSSIKIAIELHPACLLLLLLL